MINNAILQAETSGSGKAYTATILNYPLNSTADEKTQVRERVRARVSLSFESLLI
jgi:hypothetical protein